MSKVSFTLNELNMVIRACKIELTEGIKRMDSKQYDDLNYSLAKLEEARRSQYSKDTIIKNSRHAENNL